MFRQVPRVLASLILLALCGGCGSKQAPADDAGGDAGVTSDAAPPGDAHIPEAHPRIYLNPAQQTRLRTALETPTPAGARFRGVVDNQLGGGDVYGFEAWFAALLYVLTTNAAYGDFAVGLVDDWVTAEEALIAGGERAEVAFDSYLYVGEHIGNLALVYDWCYDLLTSAQRQRWVTYADQAVWNVWHPQEATWGGTAFPWSGWSVDNPSNNYYYSFLRATMLLGLASHGDSAQADGWIALFRDDKIQAQLVPTFGADLAGGGSREGTGYGVSMARLFELYVLWEETTGERIADLTPHARESLYWLTHAIAPTLDRLAPTGDHARESSAALFDYHRNYLLVLGALYPDEPGALVSRRLLADSTVPEMGQGFMAVSDFLFDPTGLPDAALDTLYPGYYGSGTGQLFLRSGWDPGATWLSVISGPYTESHAHHDQGHLLLYRDGWLAYDANVDSHSGIHQEEEAHNLVRLEVDGAVLRQVEGTTSALVALADNDYATYLAADTAPAYGGASGLTDLVREVVWLKPGLLVVHDRVSLQGGTVQKVFQLNVPVAPVVTADRVTVTGAGATLELFPVFPAGLPVEVLAWPVEDADYLDGHRIEIADVTAGETRFIHVLAVDGAATSVSAAAVAGALGVEVDLADGTHATVLFGDTGPGASVALTDGGTPVYDATFGPGVATLPLTSP